MWTTEIEKEISKIGKEPRRFTYITMRIADGIFFVEGEEEEEKDQESWKWRRIGRRSS